MVYQTAREHGGVCLATSMQQLIGCHASHDSLAQPQVRKWSILPFAVHIATRICTCGIWQFPNTEMYSAMQFPITVEYPCRKKQLYIDYSTSSAVTS